jgi:hypothetical protein
MLTDHDLITACDASRVRQYEDAKRRVYAATFVIGGPGMGIVHRTFAVGYAEAARVYAREYGVRILAPMFAPYGVRLLDVRWAR